MRTAKAHIGTAAALIIAAGGIANAQLGVDLLLDGSFDTGQLAIPPFVPEVEPDGWNDFGNAFLFGMDEAPLQTPDIGIKLFSATFSGYSIPFAVDELPDFFPFDLLPGDDTDGDGLPEVEVTDSLGTRMVEYTHIPGTNASGWNTTVGTALSEPGANAADSDAQPGDRLRLSFYHRRVSSDLILPNGAITQATISYRDAPFPAPVIEAVDKIVNIAADPEDEWVEYSMETVIPDGTTTIEVLALHFGLFTEFTPLDEDGDGVQDIVVKDINFNGVIDDFEADGAGGFVGPEGPSIDTDGDGEPDAFDTIVTIDGSVAGGAAFYDTFSLVNLGPDTPGPCNPADLSEPFGILDLADITSFVSAFNAMDPSVDYNDDGVFDLQDIVTFVEAFNAGCP